MKGVPSVNRRYTKGVPFLSKMVYKRVRGWTSGNVVENPPGLKHDSEQLVLRGPFCLVPVADQKVRCLRKLEWRASQCPIPYLTRPQSSLLRKERRDDWGRVRSHIQTSRINQRNASRSVSSDILILINHRNPSDNQTETRRRKQRGAVQVCKIVFEVCAYQMKQSFECIWLFDFSKKC